MDYKVIVSKSAEDDLDSFLEYIIFAKQNPDAAESVLEDYYETVCRLATIAGSLPEPESEILKEKGLKRINFRKHNYFALYHIDGQTVFVDKIYHDLQDVESILI